MRLLQQDSRELTASELEPVQYRAGQNIFRQGAHGDCSFIVQDDSFFPWVLKASYA